MSNGKPLTIKWAQFAGLDNRVDAAEVPQAETRYVYKPPFLSRARNVDLDAQGRPRRRPGYTSKIAGNFNSLYAAEDLCVAVKGGDMYQILPDWTTKFIRSGLGSESLSYARGNDWLFYSNSVAIGYLTQDGVDHGFSTPTEKFKVAPFPGKLIEWYKGRLYIAKENVLWFTDAMALRIDMRKGFRQLPTNITMLKAIDTGLFVSDEEATYFIGGDSPEKAVLLRKEQAAIEGAAVVIDANELDGDAQGRALMFVTKGGICIGQGNGQVKNLTADHYEMPDVTKGAAINQGSASTKKIVVRLY